MTTRTTATHPEDPTSNGPQQKNQSTWGIVIGASLISTGLAAYEIVPASVTPLIRDSRNVAIALLIATTSFRDPGVLTIIVAFGLVSLVISGPVASLWGQPSEV